MLTLVHLSDPHLPPLPQPQLAELCNKRLLGFINWQRWRQNFHRRETLDAIVQDLGACNADHIAVSGDLINLSLPAEYPSSRAWLETLGGPSDVTVVPGNHDVYVRGAERLPAKYWEDYMRGDDGLHRFPFIRRRGNAALIALSTGLPTAPFLATGCLGNRQLSRLADALDQTRGFFRIVLIHHPPRSLLRRFFRRLTDDRGLRRVLAAKGAELLLHGHDHRFALTWLDGPQGKRIPAVGAPSASAGAPHGEAEAAGYNLLRIDGAPENWRCEMTVRRRGPDGAVRDAGNWKLH